MKKTALLSAAIAAALSFSACGKDDGGGTTPPTATAGSMTATIDGNNWTAAEAGGSIINGMMNISGKTSSGQVITMTITSDKTGTYTLTGSNAGAYVLDQNGTPSFTTNAGNGATGTVTVTSINTSAKTMSGVFTMKAYRATDQTFANITNGKFTEIPYTTTIPTNTKNSFAVKIDGNSWTPAAINAVRISGKINIVASDAGGIKSVSVAVPEGVDPGSYDFVFFGDYTAQYNIDQSTFLTPDNGAVTITKHDKTAKRLEGTFAFDASEFIGPATAIITEGSFGVNY